ncbi:MAG: DMT family transporter [Nitratireductor sp.]|nr:DMT family transporter [Nitratireductor sp.]
MDLATWGLLLLLALIWGGSFLFGRIAVQEVPPLAVVFFRVALAAIAIWAWLLFRSGMPKLTPWFIGAIAGMAVFNNIIPFSLIFYGQQEIGSGLASIVNAMTPIWTVLIANVLTSDERLSARKLVGILAGFAGVAVLMGGDALAGLKASAWAQAAVLLATISYGYASVYGKRFKGIDPILVAAGQLAASTVMMAAYMLASGTLAGFALPSQAAVWSLIGLALPCTAFAYVLFFTILSRAGATNVSLVTFLVPVSGVLLGIVFLGESLSPWHIGGMVLIGLGLLVLDGRLFAARRT